MHGKDRRSSCDGDGEGVILIALVVLPVVLLALGCLWESFK